MIPPKAPNRELKSKSLKAKKKVPNKAVKAVDNK